MIQFVCRLQGFDKNRLNVPEIDKNRQNIVSQTFHSLGSTMLFTSLPSLALFKPLRKKNNIKEKNYEEAGRQLRTKWR